MVAKKTIETTSEEAVQNVAEVLQKVGEVTLINGDNPHPFDYEYIPEIVKIKDALSAPFPAEFVSFRDGPYNKVTKQKEQLRYVNVNRYEDRLNEVAFGHWSSSEPKVTPAQQWATDYETKEKYLNHGFIVTSYVTIYGVTHGGTSDFETTVTAGYAASFKRAVLKFGLGRELYDKEEVQQSATPTTTQRQAPQASTQSSGSGGYPRPTDGQIKFLARLGVPQSLLDSQINGNYVITGSIGRTLIDDLKEGGQFEGDPATALAAHGITLPATSKSNDGLPVRSGYRR